LANLRSSLLSSVSREKVAHFSLISVKECSDVNLSYVDSDIFYPEKQLFWYGLVPLKRDYMTLFDYDIKPGDTLLIQDRGVQVSYRLSQLMINIGPVLTFALFYFYRFEIYSYCLVEKKASIIQDFKPSLAQDIAFKMGLGHFAKRLFECIFVHLYSKPTKSLNRIVKEMGYFGLYFGLLVPFYLLHPDY
jgi:hypothetical protein